MDREEFKKFWKSLREPADRTTYCGFNREVFRKLSGEKALEIAAHAKSWLDAEPESPDDPDREREMILTWLAALVPECEEPYKSALWLDHDEEALFPRECWTLVAAGESAKDVRPVAGMKVGGSCEFCGLPLLALLDLDLRDERLGFLGIRGTRLRIPMCIRCSCYDNIFGEIDFEGGAVWSRHNQKPRFNGRDGEYPGEARVPLVLGARRRTPFEANKNVTWTGVSQIGGMPTWIQDARYPSCPACSRTMRFIGQVETDAAWGGDDDSYEGVTYGFLCDGCRMTATGYQQS